MSQSERQRLTRRFTNTISYVLGVNRDIPAPDVNTDAQTMAWMMRRVLGPLRLHAGDRHRQAGRARRLARAATRPPAAASSTASRRRRATTASTSPARPSPCRDAATSAPGSRGSRPSSAAGWWRSRTCAAAWPGRSGLDVDALLAHAQRARLASSARPATTPITQRGAARAGRRRARCRRRSTG